MVAIIVTARNEGERLEATLDALRAAFPAARLVVVDDASEDATPRIARGGGADLVRTERRLGKGGAATLGARRVLELPALEAVVLCDGDLGASAGRLPALVAPVADGSADLVVAAFARRAGGGVGLARGAARRAISRRTGLALSAPLSGQRALCPGVLRSVLPFAAGFGMETAMTIDAHRAGFRVLEIELELEHRATGRTPAGFLHRTRQLQDILRAARSREARRQPPGA